MIDRANKTPIKEVSSGDVSVLSTVIRSRFDIGKTEIAVPQGQETELVNRSYGTVLCVNAPQFVDPLREASQDTTQSVKDVIAWVENTDDNTEFLFLEIVVLSVTIEKWIALDRMLDATEELVAGRDVFPERVIVTLEGNKTKRLSPLDLDKTQITPVSKDPQVIRTPDGLSHALVVDVLERLNGTSRSQQTEDGLVIQVSKEDFLENWNKQDEVETGDVNADMCRVYFVLPDVAKPDLRVVDVEVGLRLVRSVPKPSDADRPEDSARSGL